MPVAAAIAGSAIVGGGVALAASSKAAKATKKAAQTASDTSLQVANENNALQREIYGQNKDALSPYVQAGLPATSSIQALLGFGDPSSASAAFDTWRNSTGYDFGLNEGLKARTAALGARGYLDSGAANKSLLKYGQDYASTGFGDYFNRLLGQQEVGRSAAAALAGVGTNYAGAVGANNTNAGNAAANAALTAGNASGNAALASANGINSALGSAVSAYSLNQGLGSSYGTPALSYGSLPSIGPSVVNQGSLLPASASALGW